MVRKIYDGYDYIDPDNLYTYPHSSVLINKFNEKNTSYSCRDISLYEFIRPVYNRNNRTPQYAYSRNAA